MSRLRVKLTPRGELVKNSLVAVLITASIIVTGLIEGGSLS